MAMAKGEGASHSRFQSRKLDPFCFHLVFRIVALKPQRGFVFVPVWKDTMVAPVV
jgi:hypothetical protein